MVVVAAEGALVERNAVFREIRMDVVWAVGPVDPVGSRVFHVEVVPAEGSVRGEEVARKRDAPHTTLP